MVKTNMTWDEKEHGICCSGCIPCHNINQDQEVNLTAQTADMILEPGTPGCCYTCIFCCSPFAVFGCCMLPLLFCSMRASKLHFKREKSVSGDMVVVLVRTKTCCGDKSQTINGVRSLNVGTENRTVTSTIEENGEQRTTSHEVQVVVAKIIYDVGGGPTEYQLADIAGSQGNDIRAFASSLNLLCNTVYNVHPSAPQQQQQQQQQQVAYAQIVAEPAKPMDR
ncbi:hypothetical protein B484DRAFT_463997 [Ochromonadaceae sp. CCMP2298]|nr:hypothetical protein B484DRAFT_463997 [Ochromonadaceae sp. CCMP2298]